MRLSSSQRGNNEKRRVVITGMGVVAPNGCNLHDFWESIVKGQSAVGVISRFDSTELPTKVSAEIKDFNLVDFLPVKKPHRFERTIQLGLAAASMAVADARLTPLALDPDRIGLVEGTSVSGIDSLFQAHRNYLNRGYRSISPLTFINAYSGSTSGELALQLGIRGHAVTYCSGSASGNDAIGYGFKMVQDDEVDVMVAGGAEAPLIEELFNGFCVTRIMTQHQDNPAQAVRPFDRRRDGFALGEGAGFLVLEDLGHALQRGARIHAEVLGHGRSCEAYHSVAPHPDGVGLRRAMEKAMRRAGVWPEKIDYINAHGTATALNDPAEANAIRSIYLKESRRPSVSSTKPVTGHLLGAAGALESIVCALALKNQIAPMTLNLKDPDDGMDLDFVKQDSRPYPIETAANLSVGFGGKNSCLILGRYPD